MDARERQARFLFEMVRRTCGDEICAVHQLRLVRVLGVKDSDVRRLLESALPVSEVRLIFTMADVMDAPPVPVFCSVCQCLSSEPARKMSCRAHTS